MGNEFLIYNFSGFIIYVTGAKSNTVPVGSTGNRSHALEGEVDTSVGNALSVADGTADGGDHPGFCIGRKLHRKGSAAGFQNCGYCLIQRCCIRCIVGVCAIGDGCDHGHVSATDTLAGGNIQGVRHLGNSSAAGTGIAVGAVLIDGKNGIFRRGVNIRIQIAVAYAAGFTDCRILTGSRAAGVLCSFARPVADRADRGMGGFGGDIIQFNIFVIADGADGNVALVGDTGSSSISYGEHGILAVHNAPIGCCIGSQQFSQCITFDGNAAGEGGANGLTLVQGKLYSARIIRIIKQISLSAGNAATGDRYLCILDLHGTVIFSTFSDGAADDISRAAVYSHAVGNIAAGDRERTSCTIYASEICASDTGIAADVQRAPAIHTYVFTVDSAVDNVYRSVRSVDIHTRFVVGGVGGGDGDAFDIYCGVIPVDVKSIIVADDATCSFTVHDREVNARLDEHGACSRSGS